MIHNSRIRWTEFDSTVERYSECSEYRSIRPEVFLVKGSLKICSKVTGEYSCRSVISINLFCNFIEITPHMGVLLQICFIFSEYFFLRAPLDDCFC